MTVYLQVWHAQVAEGNMEQLLDLRLTRADQRGYGQP
jgi:hypothetical protein